MAARGDGIRNAVNFVLAVILFCSLIGRSTQTCLNGGVLLKSGLEPSDKYDILEEHNKLRQAVAQGLVPGQPSAENMLEMQWDDELASKAQDWANRCVFKHDPKKRLGRFTMGQNLAVIWSSASLENDQDSAFSGRIRKWFDEVKKYSFGARFSLATGHYMQLVWAESFLVGCGYTYYYSSNKYNKLYVCNYGPGGNIQGQQPYIIGRPSCDHHGLQKSHKYPSLCMPAGTDPYHHDNAIPQNYYSYQTSSSNHENQHYTAASAPMAVYTAVANGLSHLSHDGHILYNLVFDQHKQQQYHYHPTGQQTTQQQAYHHLSNPLTPIATTATAALLKPASDALKSPFLTYRWDLLFNFLH